MTSSIGSASVRIEPDMTGFSRTVQLAIDQGDFEIPAEIDPAQLQLSLEVAEEALDALDLNADLDATQIAAQVEAIQQTLPELDLEADIDADATRAQLAASIEALQATLPEIDLRVGLERATAQIAAFEAFTSGALRRIGRFGVLAGIGTAAVGAAAGFVTLSTGIQEALEGSQGLQRLNAVLASTESVANVTADEALRLAENLQDVSGIDADVILGLENTLLTFTRIRNEAGAGNDVFNRATQAALDLSIAYGTDLQSAAVQVGKALNDPVKGVTALGRAGVQFTEAQKDQIESLVEANDLLGAQTIVLNELQVQFEGQATAFGQSLPGQVERAKRAFETFSLSVVNEATPSIVHFLVTVREALTGAAGEAGVLQQAFTRGIEGAAEAGVRLIAFLQTPAFASFVGQVRDAVVILGDAVEAFVRSFVDRIGGAEAASGTFIEVLGAAFVGIAEIVRDVAPVVGSLLGRIANVLGENESAVGGFAKAWLAAFAAIKALRIVRFIVQPFIDLLKPLGSAILQILGLRKAIAGGKELTRFQQILVRVGGVLRTLWPVVTSLAAAVAGFISGPVTIAIGVIAGLTAGIVALWKNSETFRTTIIHVGEWLMGLGQTAWSIFTEALRLAGEAISMVVSAAVERFSFFRRVIKNVVQFVTALLTGDFRRAGRELVQIVASFIALIVETFVAMPARIAEGLLNLGVTLFNIGVKAMERFGNAIFEGGRAIIRWFQGLPDRVSRFLDGLPERLTRAGEDAMASLLDGLEAGWENVKEFLGGIGDEIKALKGPIEVDRELLVPEGEAIMSGFGRGLRSGWDRVAGWIGDRGGFIQGLFGANDVATINDITIDTLLGNITNPGERLDALIPNVPRFWTSFTDMMLQANEIARMFNVTITSTLRSMAENTAVGGAPGSWHLFGRAVDFAGAVGNMDRLAAWAREMERFFVEILWRVRGHFDHVHLAWALPPGRQMGGPVNRGEPYLVGEAGAEIFFPEQSGFVASNKDLKSLIQLLSQGALSAGGPQVLVQPVNADPVAVGRIVAAHLSRPVRRLPGGR